MEELGIAVVGAGYWGPNLVRVLSRADGWDLRRVCDTDPGRARQAVGRNTAVETTTSLDDVLGDPHVAAVAIATPAHTHAELAIAALDAGKHVLIENPLASSLAEGEKIVEVAESRGLVVMCDHTYCYTSPVRRLRELIRSGGIGDVQYVDSVRINLGLVQSNIDVFWDLAPHDLSILDFILPESVQPTAVAAFGADPIGAGQACVGYLTLPLAAGAIAHVHVNWLSPTKIRTTIIGGSERMLVWDDLNPRQRVRMYDRGVAASAGPGADLRRDVQVSYRTGEMVAPALGEQEALVGVVGEFHDAVAGARPALTDGQAGLRVLRVLDAATKSLESGGVAIPLGRYR